MAEATRNHSKADKMKIDVVNWNSWPPEIAKNLSGGLKEPLEVHNKTKGCLETAIIDNWEAIDDKTTVIWWKTTDGQKKKLYTPMTQPEEIYERYEELCPKNEMGDNAAPKIQDILPPPKQWDSCGLKKEEILLRWLSLTAYLNEYDEKGCNVGYVFSSSNQKWFCATHWKVCEPNELHFEVFFNVENNSGQLHHKGLYIARGEFRPLPVVYEVKPGEEKSPDINPPIAAKQGMLTTTKWPGVFEYETPNGEKFPINFYYINYRCKNDAHENGNSNEKQNIIHLLKEALKPMETENRADDVNRPRQPAPKPNQLVGGNQNNGHEKRDVRSVGAIPTQHTAVRHAVAVPQAVGQPTANTLAQQQAGAQAHAARMQAALAQHQQLQGLTHHYMQLYNPQVQAGQMDANRAYALAVQSAQQHLLAAQQQAAMQQQAMGAAQLGGQAMPGQMGQLPNKYPPHNMQPGVNGVNGNQGASNQQQNNQANAQQGNQPDILHQPNLATAQAAAQAGYYQQPNAMAGAPMMMGYMPGVQYQHAGMQFPQAGQQPPTGTNE